MKNSIVKNAFLCLAYATLNSLYAQNPAYNWHDVLVMPPVPTENKIIDSPQVLHFYRVGKSVWEHPETASYIKKHMQTAKVFESDADNMLHAVQAAKSDGLFLEFGVCSAKSINFIAALSPRNVIHGFDSFEGLPEDWTDFNLAKGTFAVKDKNFVPATLNNVKLHVGMFHEVLPNFVQKEAKDQFIAFIHIDCDLYSSTKTVFDHLKSNIKPGTIIVFDEYFNYNGWQKHEYKAFQEFIADSGYSYEYLSFNQEHQQVTIKITAS